MCSERIRDKIAKLLELAGSPNEHEAKAALYKARALMAEHKLRPEEIQKPTKEEVIREDLDIVFTEYSTGWIRFLSYVIASQFCCHSLCSHFKGSKQYHIALVGLRSDLELCKAVLLYAIDCAKSGCDRARKAVQKAGGSVREQTAAAKAYGVGFYMGVNEMYEEQNREHADQSEWGLVMQTPQPVLDYINQFRTVRKRIHISDTATDYLENGKEAGKSFSPDRRLQ